MWCSLVTTKYHGTLLNVLDVVRVIVQRQAPDLLLNLRDWTHSLLVVNHLELRAITTALV